MPGSAPRATLDNPYGPAVTFRTEDVLPPSALYISMTDTFVALFSVSLPNTSFTLSVRILMPDGTIQNETYQSTTPINPQVPLIALPPVEGYLLSCVVVRNDVVNCSAYCNISLYRGAAQAPIVSLPPNAGMTVAAGYVSELGPLTWPNSPVIEPGTGAGYMRSIAPTVTTGANWSFSAGANQRLEVVAVQATLTTSAVVANRLMSLVWFDQAGGSICRFPANVALGASSVGSFYFYEGAPMGSAEAGWFTAPLPVGLMLDPGMSLQTRVQALDPGDAWSFVVVGVREWMGVGHG